MEKMMRLINISVTVISILVIYGCTNNISKEAVHDIDDLLARRMTIVQKNVEDDAMMGTKAKYNQELPTELDKSKLRTEWFNEKYSYMSNSKNEIKKGCEELEQLLKKYPKGKPGHNLIKVFMDYFVAYQKFIDAWDIELQNQINATELETIIFMFEANQIQLFDALDSDDIKNAEKHYDKETSLIKAYMDKFGVVDFREDIPSEWEAEINQTYDEMHKWMEKFLEAKKQGNDTLYTKHRLDGFQIIPKIPYDKTEKLSSMIANILYEFDPKIEALGSKSGEAELKAHSLLNEQKQKLK